MTSGVSFTESTGALVEFWTSGVSFTDSMGLFVDFSDSCFDFRTRNTMTAMIATTRASSANAPMIAPVSSAPVRPSSCA